MRDKNNTKSKIMDAMYELIASEGYEKASMGKICDSIGITKAAAYYYFKSKEEIFIEIVRNSYQEDFSEGMKGICAAEDAQSYQDMWLKLGYEYIEEYENDPKLRKVCFETDIQTYRIPQVKDIVDAYIDQMSTQIKAMLEKGSELNLIDRATLDTKAQYLQTVLIGLDKAILFQYPIQPKQVWQYTLNQLFLKEPF